MRLSEKINNLLEGSILGHIDKSFSPAQFKKFAANFKKMNKKNAIAKDKHGFYIGFRKGTKEVFWRYDDDNFKLYYGHPDDMLILNFFNLLKDDHRFY